VSLHDAGGSRAPIPTSTPVTVSRNHQRARPAIERVALILQSTSLGGMETHCVDLAAELVRRRRAVMGIVPEAAAYDELADRFLAAGALVHRLNTDARLGRVAQGRNWLRLAGILRRWRPDVVHLHTGGATGGLGAMLAARLLTTRAAVVTEHDVPFEDPGTGQRASRMAMDRCADAIVAVSRRNARLRIERIPPPKGRIVAILNGAPAVDVSTETRLQNRQGLRAQLNVGDDDLVIGSLVRLADGKGLHDLVRAFALARRGNPSTLLLVGDGPLRSELEALADELGIGAHVRFAGHQVRPLPFLDVMDAFVLAVPAGSMSMALLEAMTRGLPCVITYCGPEEPVIDQQTGLCAPPSDHAGLARVLARISADPELRARLGRAAAAHISAHFSVARVADDLLELYEACRSGSLPARLLADRQPPRGHRGQMDTSEPATELR
jgi:glycosyltransferase involved in cell wall biosynthesis